MPVLVARLVQVEHSMREVGEAPDSASRGQVCSLWAPGF